MSWAHARQHRRQPHMYCRQLHTCTCTVDNNNINSYSMVVNSYAINDQQTVFHFLGRFTLGCSRATQVDEIKRQDESRETATR